MADTTTGPAKAGKETSEYKELQWVKIAAGALGVLVAALTALLATGLIPADTGVYAVMTGIVTIGGMLSKGSGDYSASRGAVKAAEVAATALAAGPQTPPS